MAEKMDAPVPAKLAEWVDARQAQGLYFFSRKEAIKILQMSDIAFKRKASIVCQQSRTGRRLKGYRFVPLFFQRFVITHICIYLL